MLETTKSEKKKLAYSVKEAAHETSLSVPYLRNEIKVGNLKARRFGRRIIILHESLKDYLEKNF